ncbi:sugar ABC transporter substrate-binding protein [Gracilibacillus marinus]|uniref:Sugar ABC transporter substrate-binding protein n=1 Tax=Gracilibacillus marinus TaxID=630535 RepID=A0ABV8VSK2_9BACI
MKQTKLFSLLLAVLFVLFLAACGSSNDDTTGEEAGKDSDTTNKANLEGVPEAFTKEEPLKIMVVRKIGGDDHTAQFLAGAQQEAQALGMEVDTFSANGDTEKFHNTIQQAIDQDYDGLIISHGDDAATVELVTAAREKGMEVVTFDSIPDLLEVDGVTLTSQNDEELAKLALDKLVEEQGKEAKIAYLWVDGFPPMVRRNNIYTQVLEENPNIEELERFGVANDNTTVDTQNAVAAWLNKYPEGEIDAIFATWDAFATGATRALTEAGRDEIAIYGIDVSNADLQLMQEEGSPWKYTAAVDPKLIGSVNVRLLAKKLAGEETPQEYSLEASLISQEDLNASGEEVNMETLQDVIDGWGETDAFLEDWMITLKEAK